MKICLWEISKRTWQKWQDWIVYTYKQFLALIRTALLPCWGGGLQGPECIKALRSPIWDPHPGSWEHQPWLWSMAGRALPMCCAEHPAPTAFWHVAERIKPEPSQKQRLYECCHTCEAKLKLVLLQNDRHGIICQKLIPERKEVCASSTWTEISGYNGTGREAVQNLQLFNHWCVLLWEGKWQISFPVEDSLVCCDWWVSIFSLVSSRCIVV